VDLSIIMEVLGMVEGYLQEKYLDYIAAEQKFRV
jgi:hypothetical protein